MASALPRVPPLGPTPGRGGPGFPLTPVLLLLALVGAIVADARFSRTPLWTVRRIEVSGNRSITQAELLARLHLHPGLPWWKVSLHPASRLSVTCPRLRRLHVSWGFPRDLAIAVEERESCLRILGPPALEVSPDGTLLDPREALDPADLPLLTGSLPAGFKVGARCDFPAAPGWQELLALNDDAPELWHAISEIHYDGGAEFQIYLREGRKVILWETDTNRDVKKQVTQILGELRQQGVKDAVVDLRFRDQAVVRLPEAAVPDSARPHLQPARTRTHSTQETPKRRRQA